MLATGFPFDSVQMPLNAFDSHFHSFEQEVLPELNRRGIAALGMKPICGHGTPVQRGVLTGEEALRYAKAVAARHKFYRIKDGQRILSGLGDKPTRRISGGNNPSGAKRRPNLSDTSS